MSAPLATGFVSKQSGENERLTVDVTANLSSGETVSGTPVVSVEAIESGSGAAEDLNFSSISATDGTIVFYADGGTHGTIYRILVEYSTSDDRDLEVDCLLLVDNGTPALTSAIAPQELHPWSLTYADLLEYLQHLTGSGGQARNFADFKQAIISAYQELRAHHDWQGYLTEHRIWLNQPFTSGTVSYDHTGHAQGERAVTFSDTPPSWIMGSRLRVNERVYAIRQATADPDVFLLDPAVAPSEDFAATGFEAYQTHYPLPASLLRMEEVFLEDGPWYTHYVSPQDWMHHERRGGSSGQPWAWTVLPDNYRHGAYVLAVFPQPDQVESLGFFYYRGIQPLRWSGRETAATAGTATGTATARVVPLSGGAADASMVGSVLRLSTSPTALPTGLAGPNPYTEQHLIVGINGNNLTLATPLAQSYSGAKYAISDLVDIAPTMTEALKAGARWKLRQNTGSREMAGSQDDFYRQIRLAQAGEVRVSRDDVRLAPFLRGYGEARFNVIE